MKVAVLNFCGYRGGPEVSLSELVDLLEKRGVTVDRYLLRKSRQISSKTWERLKISRTLGTSPIYFKESLEILNSYDIVITVGTNLDDREAEGLTNETKLILHCDARLFIYFPGWVPCIDDHWSSLLVKKADGILVSREKNKKDWLNVYPDTRVKVLPFPTNVMKFNTSHTEESLKERNIYLFTPRYSSSKRPTLFMSAFKCARQEFGLPENVKSRFISSALWGKDRLLLSQAIWDRRVDYLKNFSVDSPELKMHLSRLLQMPYTKEDLQMFLKTARFTFDFTNTDDNIGFSLCQFESIVNGVLPVITHGWDVCGGDGMIELPAETNVSRTNKKSSTAAGRLFREIYDMSAAEYNTRLSYLRDYLLEHHDEEKIASNFISFIS